MERRNPLLTVGLVTALGFAGWSFLAKTPASSAPAEPEPPELFDDPGPCEHTGARAAHEADLSERAAVVKMDRFPFSPADGVAAVQAAARARACYAASDAPAAAERVRRRIDRWRRELEQSYRARRVRLALARRRGDREAALGEVRALRSLLSHRTGAYVSKLSRLERELSRKATK